MCFEGWGGGSFWNPIASGLEDVVPPVATAVMTAGMGDAALLPETAATLGESAETAAFTGTGSLAAEGGLTGTIAPLDVGATGTGEFLAGPAAAALPEGTAETALGALAGSGLGDVAGASGTGADAGPAAVAGTSGPAAAVPSASAPVTPATSGVTPGVASPGSAGPAGAMGPIGDPGVGATQAQADLSAGMGGNAAPYGADGTTAAATPESSSGGLGKLAKEVIGEVKPYAQVAGLGLQGASAVMNATQAAAANKMMKQANDAAIQANQTRQAAAQPAVDYGKATLQQAQAGTLTDAQEAQLATTKQQMKARIDQYLANAGLSDSTTAQEWYDWIDQQITAQRATLVQQNAQLGINAIGTASGAAPAGTTPSTADAASMYQASLTSAEKSLGQLAAVGA